jgi:hypothetical protein
MDAYDVHTGGEGYWVITQPTNLYSHRLFPSLDYTLSFHVGVTARMMAHRKSTDTDEHRERRAAAWRWWTQAVEAFEHADEAEDFQAVGMRCRECLVAMVQADAQPSMVPERIEKPKTAAFIQRSELIADAIAAGPSAGEVRGYLKAIADLATGLVVDTCWQRSPLDAGMALYATKSTLAAFSLAVIRTSDARPIDARSVPPIGLGPATPLNSTSTHRT